MRIDVAARIVDANLKGETMEIRIVDANPIPDLSKKARRAPLESGLWLRIGFIGASGVAAGLIQLINGEVKPVSALALAVGGGVLAALSWWRARAVLEDADKETPVAPSPGRDRAMAGA